MDYIFWKIWVLFCLLTRCLSQATSPNLVSVHEGADAVLPCEYHHPGPDPPPSVIEWLRQGQQLPVYIKIGKYSPQVDPTFGGRMKVKSSKADLIIKRIEATDEGWYECRVIFLRKEKNTQAKESLPHSPFVNGTWVKLVVTAPPVFKYTPPNSITAKEGEVLLLRCRSAGRPVPVITWHKDGSSIKNGQDGIRLSDGELAVTSLKKNHKGKYMCRAQNVEGQIEHSTQVYIQGPPEIKEPPKNSTVKEGQDAMFSCRAEGFPTTIDYRWFYNDVSVTSSDAIRGRYSVQDGGAFTIYNVVADDRGTVACRASNGYGKAPMASATLTVQFPARVNKMPSILYAGLGLKTTLPCPAVAVPQISTVTWRKNEQVVNMDQDGRYSLGENGSLVISDVKQRDAARYTCTPYNILGTLGESTGTQLVVRYPPYFTKAPKPEYVAEIGKQLVIQCEGAGDPPPHVSWVKLDENNEEEVIEDSDDRLSFENGNLTIDSVAKSDHGSWQCVLSNAVAAVKFNVMVLVTFTTPHAVTNINLTTSRHSAQISWVAGYNGGYSQHFMIWYKRADMGDHSWQTQSVESFRKVATVSNLEADTIYQFALLPENVLGSGQFSKTVTAKTKEIPPPTPTLEPESIPPPSRMESHIKEDSGLLLLMWQPPLDAKEEDLLGYIIEFRMLFEVDDQEGDIVIENEDSYSLPLENRKKDEESNRTRRSIRFWNNMILSRTKRDEVPSTDSPPHTTPESKERWSAWGTLTPVDSNVTSYVVPDDKLFRDQLYEFQVLTVSKSAYSAPSAPITISTKDLTAYPVFVEPVAYATGGVNPAVIAGVAAALLFVIIVIIMTSWWCHFRRRRKDALDSSDFTFGNVADDKFDRRTKSESPSDKSGQSKSSSRIRDEKTGPLAKLKKKMWKADVEVGIAYCSTEELVGLGRKVSATKQNTSDQTESDQHAQLIRKISRASDGKFHISDQSSIPSDSVLDAGETDSLVPHKTMSPSRSSRSQSMEWDPRSPLLEHPPRQTPDNGSESLEIDCSQSDIEVRYVKEGRENGRCQSTSMTSLVGPRQYNLPRRVAGPYDPVLNSSADSSYPLSASSTRQSMTSPAPGMSQYAQYVHIRPDGSTRRNPEYRVSSPPRFSDFNPTPASPSKYRYHKHTDQPGGHYHVSPRDSFVNPAERLVYDPRYTRIEPIYEVGPYHTANPPNRHSSFVIDSRRELPHHPHPHRAIQIYRTNTSNKDVSNYPKPVWHNRGAAGYHTLPPQPQASLPIVPRHTSVSIDSDNVETSLMRHNANAVNLSRNDDIRGPPSATNTNSLGRSRSKSYEKNGSSPRRRVYSVDDLTRDSPLPANSINVSKNTGSVDLLSPRRSHTTKTDFNGPLSPPTDKDRTRVGYSRVDEKSDVTIGSSSLNSDELPRGAVTSRHSDLRDERRSNQLNNDDITRVVISSPPTSPRDDDSSALSSLVHHTDDRHRPIEVGSSGYDSHNTSHASDSPAPSLPTCSSPNVIVRTSSHAHDRTSTASSSDRSRKDTSSVDEKYEWDSEFAMESEILEALRHFGTHNKTGSVSQALVDEIQKLGVDQLQEMGKGEIENLEKAMADRDLSMTQNDLDQSTAVDTSDMYTKESMERRCAALKKEYQRYQLGQVTTINQKSPTSPNNEQNLISS